MSIQAASSDAIVITGRLDHLGNGVNCPEIITDDGTPQPVFGLTAETPIGTRLRLTGHLGIATRCLGEVLVIETIEVLKD